jgi:peptidoglycan/LPS O-acetylase OafA/YrhL
LLIYFLINKKTGTQWDVSIPVTSWDVITHFLLIQDLFSETHAKINHAFWSISVEWRIYFIFPLLLIGWRRWGPFRITMCAILASTFLWYALTQTNLNFSSMSPHYLALFAFGMYSAHISKSSMKQYVVIRKKNIWTFAVPVFLILIISTMASSEIQRYFSPLYTDYLVGLGSACLLIALSSGHLWKIRKIFSWKPLVFIGTFAYSIYLIHAPLLQLVSQYFVDPLGLSTSGSLLLFFTLGIPAIIGCAYLFYLLAERPFVNKKAR